MILMIEINREEHYETISQLSIKSLHIWYFLIITIQMGVGMLGFERISAKLVGNDAWISTLLLEYLLIL